MKNEIISFYFGTKHADSWHIRFGGDSRSRVTVTPNMGDLLVLVEGMSEQVQFLGSNIMRLELRREESVFKILVIHMGGDGVTEIGASTDPKLLREGRRFVDSLNWNFYENASKTA